MILAKKIYLASRSPRRRELLTQIGVGFDLLLLRDDMVRGIDVDETPLPGESPHDYVVRVSYAKADVGLQRVQQRRLPIFPLLAADTAVVLDGKIMGKPADRDEAINMLLALSGRRHEVFTAVTVANAIKIEQKVSVTVVQFGKLTDQVARHYAMTGEPFDKAGAYAIQGHAAAFVEKIEGSYSGVMGLPLFETTELLASFGIEVL